MLDNDFDNIFKSRLSQQQEFDFQEKDWQLLAPRLPEHKPHIAPFGRDYLKRAAIAAALLLAISNVFLLQKLHNSENARRDLHITQLQEQVKALQIAQNTSEVASPKPVSITHQPKETTIKFEPTNVSAGFKVKTKNPVSNDAFQLQPNILASNLTPQFAKLNTQETLNPKNVEQVANTPNNIVKTKPDEVVTLANNFEENATPFKITPISHHSPKALPLEKAVFNEKALDYTTKEKWYYGFVPINFNIGIVGGTGLSPLQFIDEPDDVLEGGVETGLRGEVVFASGMRLFTDVDFLKMVLVSRNREEVQAPEIDPPGEFYRLNSVAANQSAIQITLGMKYVFDNESRINPYLAVGFKSQQGIAQKYLYHFNNLIDGEVAKTEVQANDKHFSFNTANFNAGIEYELSKDLLLQMEGFYNTKITIEKKFIPSLYGVKAGVLFNI